MNVPELVLRFPTFFFFAIIKDTSANMGILFLIQSYSREAFSTANEVLGGSGLIEHILNLIWDQV